MTLLLMNALLQNWDLDEKRCFLRSYTEIQFIKPVVLNFIFVWKMYENFFPHTKLLKHKKRPNRHKNKEVFFSTSHAQNPQKFIPAKIYANRVFVVFLMECHLAVYNYFSSKWINSLILYQDIIGFFCFIWMLQWFLSVYLSSHWVTDSQKTVTIVT